MDFLNEAFKSLKRLNEETFDLSAADGQDELKNFIDDDEEIDTITIIDDEAEDVDEIKDSYIGKVILDCNICHSLIYKDKGEVFIDEEGENANIDEECPYCYSQGDGFKIIGQVKPFTKDDYEDEEEDSEEETEIEVKEDEVEDETPEIEEESLNESCEKEGCESKEDKDLDELFDVNAQGQTIGVGVGGGTGITATPGGMKIPGISEGCDESIGDDLSEYQKWVDYDMKKYGQISHLTKRKIKKAGLEVIKDDHGDYEVIANRPNESKTEGCNTEESLKESIQDMSLTTDDGTEVTMSSGEGGEVTITTKPGCEECVDKQSDETIGEIDLGTELDIENNSQEDPSVDDIEPESDEDEIEIDDFDEESFDELGESYLKKVYENVDSFKVSKVHESNSNRLFIEGLITFNSGNTKKTNFVFKNKGVSKSGKTVFEGYNKEITRSNKSFRLNGRVDGNRLISESLSYRYTQNKQSVNGTVKRG